MPIGRERAATLPVSGDAAGMSTKARRLRRILVPFLLSAAALRAGAIEAAPVTLQGEDPILSAQTWK
jgi:hypothetical protein